MLLWLSFAILTAAVVAALLLPLRHASPSLDDPADADLAVYRDQLREIEAERERGLVVEAEIEGARAEVARRILKRAATKADSGSTPAAPLAVTGSDRRARLVYAAIAAVMPLAGVALYVATGSPGLPARPFAERQGEPVAADTSVVDLIGRVEERLRQHPEDGKGWDVIAPIYLRLGRYADSAHAFAEANRLEGETVRRILGFAEATLLAERGIVTEPVRIAARRVLQLEPSRIEVKVWLILAKEQDGDLTGAIADYRALLADAPQDAPWRKAVNDRIAVVEKKLHGEPDTPAEKPQPQQTAPPAAATGPAPDSSSAPDIAAMSPAEREAFITSMVDRLAARLKDDGKDFAGWIRLARAYKVLGREDDARAALASARQNFAGDDAAQADIGKAEQEIGTVAREQAPE